MKKCLQFSFGTLHAVNTLLHLSVSYGIATIATRLIFRFYLSVLLSSLSYC